MEKPRVDKFLFQSRDMLMKILAGARDVLTDPSPALVVGYEGRRDQESSSGINIAHEKNQEHGRRIIKSNDPAGGQCRVDLGART